mgnify:CR=1 FL=1
MRTLSFIVLLGLAAQAQAHGTRGYPLGSEPAQWKLFELAISSAHAGNVRFAIEGDYRIISSDGHNLLVFNPKKDRNWQPVRGPVLNGITRIAVSPDGKKIAVVVSE